MLRRYLFGILAFVLAFGILSVSLMKSCSITFAVAGAKSKPASLASSSAEINYQIVYPGKILPGSPLWPLKALRDRVWYLFSFGHLKKAEAALLFADKRLAFSELIFEKGKADLGLTVLAKAEKYLETAGKEERLAREKGVDTSEFLVRLANASLKHWEVIEEKIIPMSPGDASPYYSIIRNYPKEVFRDASEVLVSIGKESPKNPFDGQ